MSKESLFVQKLIKGVTATLMFGSLLFWVFVHDWILDFMVEKMNFNNLTSNEQFYINILVAILSITISVLIFWFAGYLGKKYGSPNKN
jgi:hypothetical protein